MSNDREIVAAVELTLPNHEIIKIYFSAEEDAILFKDFLDWTCEHIPQLTILKSFKGGDMNDA